jgi:hypothetical protein
MFMAGLMKRAIELLIFYSKDMEEAHAIEIAEFFEPWDSTKRYSSGVRMRHGANDETGRAILWETTRAVQPNGNPPDRVPNSYRQLN